MEQRPWYRFYEKNVPHSLDISDIPLSKLLTTAVHDFPDRDAISYFGYRMNYQELGKKVDQFAIALFRLGVRRESKVAIMLPNLPQYVIAHFAILKLGAIIVPVNPLYVERELEYQLNDSGAETIIALDLFLPKIKKVKSDTALRHVIVTRVQEYLPFYLKMLYPIKAVREGNWIRVDRAPGIHFYKDLMAENFVMDLPNIEIAASDIAMFLYTGGTTGVAKGAILTHRNLVANVMQIRAWYNEVETGEESVLCALPFFHSYALTTCLHLAVLLSSKMVLIPNPRDIKTLLNILQKERATLFSGVPTLFVAINNFPEVKNYDLSSVKCCVSGGAPLPMQVARQFEAIAGGRLVEGYGLSETSPVTHANPIKGRRKEGSIGLPLSNTDAKIVDPESKKEVGTGEVGELAVRGPQVMQGYWNMPEETELVLRDGWLFTGDLAKMDAEGYFYIVDRQKDMIVASGFNIYPREIEEVLYQHPQIVEAAVIGVSDEYRGETVKAFIVLRKGVSLKEKEIIAFCKDKLASFKIPRLIEFRETLPKSNIGKVLRRVLKDEENRC